MLAARTPKRGSGTRPVAGSTRRRVAAWLAGGLATALVVTLAVVANGFDSRETPREEPAVWVERSAGQYARVNTETAEIDTVRVAENPSGVVQSGSLGVLLTQGYGRATVIDPARPQDVVDDAGDEGPSSPEDKAADNPDTVPTQTAGAAGKAGVQRTPDGTRQVLAAGSQVVFVTEDGQSYLATARSGGELGTPRLLDPQAESGAGANAAAETGTEAYRATAVALDERGRVLLLSAAEGTVRWFDTNAGNFVRGTIALPAGVPRENVQAAIVGGKWVALDTASGALWLEGRAEPLQLQLTGAGMLQDSNADDSDIMVADEAGLWRVSRSGEVERVASATGRAAQPRTVNGETVAAWIDSAGATLWTPERGAVALPLDPSVEDLSNASPEIRTNGARGLVVDRQSGMMWTVPDGKLIPLEQWTLVDPPKQDVGVVVTQEVTEQEPPVAVDDAFGVRAGESVLLPVLLNDYDPNRKDVLTIVQDGLGAGLDPAFGTLGILSNGQGLTIQVSEAARGVATFSYRITDGTALSEPATVTLTVFDESVNHAPEWCPVEGCQRKWPSPELAPGGTLILPILEGWVDPEGDPMLLASVAPVDPNDSVRALVTADGTLAIRHTDPNADPSDIALRLRVADARGLETERELRVRIRNNAALDFPGTAATVELGETLTLRPLERVTGGSGSFQLIDATVQQGAAKLTVNSGRGTIAASSEEVGESILAVTVRDALTEQETTGLIRLSTLAERPALSIPPLTAFVRALADTTVDVLAAIPGANSRSLTVQSAAVVNGQLRADVIEHSRVRVSGATADGQPGRIGALDVIVAEAGHTAKARMTVFQVPDAASGVIAVADAATVRVGAVVDIPVLENDVAPPGERLVLHPEIGAPGIDGELAFASGSQVRYLAPQQPGVYTLSYTTYSASNPEQRDVGQVRVTVLPEGSNRDPQPATITARVAPGEQARVTVPLSGVDPDGDRVRLVGVEAPTDSQLTASLMPRTNAIQVSASQNAQRGTQTVGYTVRDSAGAEAVGTLRIIVTEPDPGGGAPIVYSDYVRIQLGASTPVAVRPLDNDIDPAGGTLELLTVVPNVPGGAGTEQWDALASRIDLGELSRGVVRITGTELGTFSYRYTVRSSVSKSTADGLIVVQVSERVGQQAPAVIDTVLSVRDRTELAQQGVDVVTDRVRWAGGDASQLRLSLWGATEGKYRVSGNRISGAYLPGGDVVPFKLAGLDANGQEVQTFGFMVVPPLDELRLALKPGVAPISVEEGKSVEVSIADMLDLGPGDRIVLDDGAFPVQRAQASCEASGTQSIRYSAGREAPWADSCTIRVRLTEQRTYTLLPIPVSVIPNAPAVQLTPLTRTIAPGAQETIELSDMVQWQGGRKGDLAKLRWNVSGGGAGFEVSVSGGTVTATARADATPGRQAVLSVSASGAGESQSALTLRVGEAAVDAPRGATVALQCRVGAECGAPLVGVAGEHDPFAGKTGGGLKLVAVDGAACSYGKFSAAGDAVRVSWADARGPGGKCTVGYTVRDAQQRVGNGTIEFDAQGVPRAPASISLAAYDESSVTLEVSLGEAANAHPAVSGVTVAQDGGGSVGSCTPSGASYRCVVRGLPVGERHSFTARAVNAVGDSDPTANAVEGWAYKLPSLSAGQIALKQTALGRVQLSVAAADQTVSRFAVSGGGVGTVPGPGGETVLRGVAPGEAVSFTVTPVSQFAPPIAGVGQEGTAVTVSTRVIGQVAISAVRAVSEEGSKRASVTFTLDGGFDDAPQWGISQDGQCVVSDTGTSGSGVVEAPGPYQDLAYTVCAKNAFSEAQSNQSVWVGGTPPAPQVVSGFVIAPYSSAQGGSRSWNSVVTQPEFTGLVSGAKLSYSTGGAELQSVPVGGQVTVAQCAGGRCSATTPVSAAGPAATSVTRAAACVAADGDLLGSLTIVGRSDAPRVAVEGTTLVVSWDGWEPARFDGAVCAPQALDAASQDFTAQGFADVQASAFTAGAEDPNVHDRRKQP